MEWVAHKQKEPPRGLHLSQRSVVSLLQPSGRMPFLGVSSLDLGRPSGRSFFVGMGGYNAAAIEGNVDYNLRAITHQADAVRFSDLTCGKGPRTVSSPKVRLSVETEGVAGAEQRAKTSGRRQRPGLTAARLSACRRRRWSTMPMSQCWKIRIRRSGSRMRPVALQPGEAAYGLLRVDLNSSTFRLLPSYPEGLAKPLSTGSILRQAPEYPSCGYGFMCSSF